MLIHLKHKKIYYKARYDSCDGSLLVTSAIGTATHLQVGKYFVVVLNKKTSKQKTSML